MVRGEPYKDEPPGYDAAELFERIEHGRIAVMYALAYIAYAAGIAACDHIESEIYEACELQAMDIELPPGLGGDGVADAIRAACEEAWTCHNLPGALLQILQMWPAAMRELAQPAAHVRAKNIPELAALERQLVDAVEIWRALPGRFSLSKLEWSDGVFGFTAQLYSGRTCRITVRPDDEGKGE